MKSAPPRSLPLRSKFLLTVLVGVVLPLALIGLWLTRTAERSGRELLRDQMNRSLEQIAGQIGERWVHRRSDLLLLVENEAVQQALRGAGRVGSESMLRYLQHAFSDMQDEVDYVLYRDLSGAARWRLTADPARLVRFEPLSGEPAVVPASPGVSINLGIPDRFGGGRLGTAEARLRLSGLLPPGAERSGVSSAVLAVVDPRSGSPLQPARLAPELLARGEFQWEGSQWLAVRRSVGEPAMELVLAAPLAPYTEPFRRTARQGVAALFAVAAAVLGLALLMTRRLTGSLEQLAVAADAVSHGDLDRKVDARASDEVGRVASAFNTMTESLRRTLRELSQRQALAAVGEFASHLAHEIRNPLTSIRLDLQLVEEKLPADSRARNPLSRALREIERLNRTVTGGLRVARSGSIREERFDLREPLEGAFHAAAPEFAVRGAEMMPLAAGDHPVWIRGDSGALQQVFLNLLINAAQALPSGGRAGARIAPNGRGVAVAVWDDGPGIPPETMEKVFEPFFTTKEEGTGLGLAISHRIVAAHGGEIEIDSTLGRGTTFHVRLPLDGVRSQNATSTPSAGSTGNMLIPERVAGTRL